MSRIGKNQIKIPDGVSIDLKNHNITVIGHKGSLELSYNRAMTVTKNNGSLVVYRSTDESYQKALHGTTRQLIQNMVTGVSKGFVKELELISDSSKILVKRAKPNFKSLGPKFGKNMQTVSKSIFNLNGGQIDLLENGETLNLKFGSFSFELSLEDVEVVYEDIEGWQVGSENGYTIALDISVDQNLKNEGISREVVNKIQNLRKDSNFNVSDKIIINIVNNNLINKALKDNMDYIKNETLAVEINFVDQLDSANEFEFDNIKLELEINKIS